MRRTFCIRCKRIHLAMKRVHHVALQIASYHPTLINATDSITLQFDPVTIDLFLVQGYVSTFALICLQGCVPYPRSTQISLALRRSHEDSCSSNSRWLLDGLETVRRWPPALRSPRSFAARFDFRRIDADNHARSR